MDTAYVCSSLISPHANFCNDRTMWTTLFCKKKIAGGGKSRDLFVPTNENEEEIFIRLL